MLQEDFRSGILQTPSLLDALRVVRVLKSLWLEFQPIYS